jgi:7,8-dihydroneopterin aldolase/epimerase/oxygenase
VEPTSTVISIDGIQARGRHGANPGEQLEPQEFVVDVAIWVEVTSDSLEGTLDYRVIVDRVRGTVSGSSFVLLEALAEAVASDLMDFSQFFARSSPSTSPAQPGRWASMTSRLR